MCIHAGEKAEGNRHGGDGGGWRIIRNAGARGSEIMCNDTVKKTYPETECERLGESERITRGRARVYGTTTGKAATNRGVNRIFDIMRLVRTTREVIILFYTTAVDIYIYIMRIRIHIYKCFTVIVQRPAKLFFFFIEGGTPRSKTIHVYARRGRRQRALILLIIIMTTRTGLKYLTRRKTDDKFDSGTPGCPLVRGLAERAKPIPY